MRSNREIKIELIDNSSFVESVVKIKTNWTSDESRPNGEKVSRQKKHQIDILADNFFSV